MNERQLAVVSEIIRDKGRIYVKEVDGLLHVSIHVFSRDIGLIDKLARSGVGRVNTIPGGTRDWSWARRHELRKYLPGIVSRMPEGRKKELLAEVYRSTIAGQRRQEVLLALQAVLQGRTEDEGDPDSGDRRGGGLRGDAGIPEGDEGGSEGGQELP